MIDLERVFAFNVAPGILCCPKELKAIIRRASILPAMAMLVVSGVSSGSAQETGYLLNPGDVLEISVWKEEGMEKQVLILPDGMISYPLAGHLKAAGRTPLMVEQTLVKMLQRYIPDPVVTVSVAGLGGYKFYVIGQVKNPGEYTASRQIDVVQSLSLAGGLTPFADENDIIVLRRHNEKQEVFHFNYTDVEKGRNLEMNILLKSGDIIVVPD